MSEQTSSTRQHIKGPFTATVSDLSVGGRPYISMKMTLTQELMVPIDDSSRYRDILDEAEKTVLSMLNDRVFEVMEDVTAEHEDK